MNRAVLIVTPFFAPQNHAAVFRAYKLAKYLPQFGWKPVVLTVDTQYEYNEDPALLEDLPAEVEIVRARYIEPSLRGMRMALGGRDRTFKSTKHVSLGRDSATKPNDNRFSKRAYRYLIKNWLQNPDAYWTWARTAIEAGKATLRDRDIAVVYTSCSPYSSLIVGMELQKAGARWVADFRDPLGYSLKMASYTPRVYSRQRSLVSAALTHADAVTFLSSSYPSIFRDVFGIERTDHVFIPTGVDQELMKSSTTRAPRLTSYLIFAGEYLPEYDTSFLESFATTIRHPEVERMNVKLLVIGTLEINRRRLTPLIDKLGLRPNIDFADQMSQGAVFDHLRDAVAGVLIPGPHAFWWTNFAKMTDYIGLRKPVVAVVPDPSEARTALTRSRLGIFLDGSASNRVEILTDFLLGRHEMPAPNEAECERYTARHQVKSFVAVFESLIGPRTSTEVTAISG